MADTLGISNAPKEYPVSEQKAKTEKAEIEVVQEEVAGEKSEKKENVLSIWTYDFSKNSYDKTEIRGGNLNGLMINRGEKSVFLP